MGSHIQAVNIRGWFEAGHRKANGERVHGDGVYLAGVTILARCLICSLVNSEPHDTTDSVDLLSDSRTVEWQKVSCVHRRLQCRLATLRPPSVLTLSPFLISQSGCTSSPLEITWRGFAVS